MSNELQTVPATRPWREEAATAVVDALYQRHPALAERFGPRGVKACREDINHHLDYLDSALETGEPALFLRYAQWLKGVLESRGVPSTHLGESFDLLAKYLEAQMPADAGARAGKILAEARHALAGTDVLPFVQPRVPAFVQADDYRLAALGGNHHAATNLVTEAMAAGSTLCEASVRLVQPAMVEIGRLWQENRITVSQEHLATAVSQNVLARAYMQASFAPSNDRTALFAAVAGNHHSLGLRMLADAFETIGWEGVFLGADVPLRDLIRQVDASAPELLCLSVSLPSHLAVARETIETLRAELGCRCPTIWVGGQATLISDRVWRSVRADGWAADALHALEQVGS